MHKSTDVDEIMDTARRLMAGETLISPEELVDMLILAGQSREEEREARASIEQLTRREMQVLKALAEGLTNKEIAERLVIAEKTARNHISHILEKKGFSNRVEIARYVFEQR